MSTGVIGGVCVCVRYRMEEVEQQLVRRVAGLQDSDDTEALYQLFQAGWRAWPPLTPHSGPPSPGHRCQLEILALQVSLSLAIWRHLDVSGQPLTDSLASSWCVMSASH